MSVKKQLNTQHAFLLSGCFLSLSACSTSPSIFNPASDNAAAIAKFSWLLFAVASIVFIAIAALLLWTVWRNHTPADVAISRETANEPRTTPAVLIFGAILPTIVLFIIISMGVFFLPDTLAFSVLAEDDVVQIQVIGKLWWWEIHYPDHDVITANEIYIPVGQPVRLYLTTDDVNHSLWLPELRGRRDMIPGETSVITIQVNEAGTYTGFCAEYCGIQHANMRFLVIAVSEDEFAQWLEHQAQPAEPPDPENAMVMEGYEAFMGSACVYCHTIRDTHATGVIGPDLTHIASRQTLAANTLANNHGNLMGWTLNSQTIKPGNYMPPIYLDATQVDALIAYLETLE
jgi:cytochrome c oxidase subunit II